MAGLVKPVEDPQRGHQVRGRAVDDDAVGTLGLDHDLIPGTQTGRLKALDRQGHLMLAGDTWHAFTLSAPGEDECNLGVAVDGWLRHRHRRAAGRPAGELRPAGASRARGGRSAAERGPGGLSAVLSVSRGTATAITPPESMAILRASYPVQIAVP
jgi:hypothetical protein